MEKEQENFKSIRTLIADANNQIGQFHFFTAEEAKARIDQWDFKTLEAYTGKTKEALEKEFPGVCDAYNALVEEFKAGEFDEVRFREILKEAYEVTHRK